MLHPGSIPGEASTWSRFGAAIVPYRGQEPKGAHISVELPQALRLNMVNGQLRTGGIVDQGVAGGVPWRRPASVSWRPAYASLAYTGSRFAGARREGLAGCCRR